MNTADDSSSMQLQTALEAARQALESVHAQQCMLFVTIAQGGQLEHALVQRSFPQSDYATTLTAFRDLLVRELQSPPIDKLQQVTLPPQE